MSGHIPVQFVTMRRLSMSYQSLPLWEFSNSCLKY